MTTAVLCGSLGCAAPEATSPTSTEASLEAPGADSQLDTWRHDLDEWRQVRDANLRDPEGWLSLVGLHWLDGSATLGSGDGHDIVLPASAPLDLGTLRVHDRDGAPAVRFDAAPGQSVTIGGGSVESAELDSDLDQQPTVVESGSVRFYIIDRDGRLGVRVRDLEHPALAEFQGMDAFPADPGWRIRGRFEPHPVTTTLSVPTVLGNESPQQSPGVVAFEHEAQIYRIQALEGGEPGELFLVFGDLTNGHTTYGGGRFLYATTDTRATDGESAITLDFNRAYNPPCVFSPYATCPLPPPENRLDVAIEAGEKSFGKPHL